RLGPRPGEILGQGRRRAGLVQEVEEGAALEAPARRVVRGGPDEPLLQLSRSPPRDAPQEQGRARLGRGAGRGPHPDLPAAPPGGPEVDRKSTRLNSSHVSISYAVF